MASDLRLPANHDPGTEYWFDLSVSVSESTDWSDEGHEIAFEQFKVPIDTPDTETTQLPSPSSSTISSSIEETDIGFTIAGEGFEYAFDEALGTLASMKHNGTERIERGPLFNFWRAPIMNEVQDWGAHPASSWYELGLDDIRYEIDSVEAAEGERVVDIEVHGRALGTTEEGPPAGYETTYCYRVFGTGAVRVEVRADPTDRLVEAAGEWLPKVGLQLETPRSLDQFEWYGRGPEETYPDRKTGVRIGRYSGAVDEQYVPYLPPQDNGNKADTRWAALTDGNSGLLAFGRSTLNVSLEQYTNLNTADYQYELEERDSIGFNLDHAVTGVGGTPVATPTEYQVQPETTEFTVTLCPITDGDDPMRVANRTIEESL